MPIFAGTENEMQMKKWLPKYSVLTSDLVMWYSKCLLEKGLPNCKLFTKGLVLNTRRARGYFF